MTEELTKNEIFKRIEEDIRDNEKLRDQMSEKYLDLSIQSLTQMRQWVFAIVTLSSAILGFSVSIGKHNSLILNDLCVYVAVFFLIFVIVFALYKMKASIEHDLDSLPEHANALRESANKVINAKRKCLFEQTAQSHEELKKLMAEESEKIKNLTINPPKRNYDFDIILFFFVIALACLVLSMVDFRYLGKGLCWRNS